MIVALIGLAPGYANAQSNVRCNGCVGNRDLANNAVTTSKIKRGTISFNRLSKGVRNRFSNRGSGTTEDVYEVANINNEEISLASNGQLRMFARCVVNDGITDRLQIVGTSTADNWYHHDLQGVASQLLAGDEVILIQASSTFDREFVFPARARSIVGADGSFIGFTAGSVTLGLNIHGDVCTVIGRIITISGRP